MAQDLEESSWASRFLPPPAPAEEEAAVRELDVIVGEREFLPGVQDSSAALSAELRVPEPAPVRVAARISQRTLWLVPACGGAGVSTLAGLLGEHVLDATEQAPIWSGRAVVVAPTHPGGLAGAERLALAKARGELTYDVVGLVWVHDRPNLSDATGRECRRIGAMFPRFWSMPYEAAWREPGTEPVPHRHNTKTLIRSLSRLTRTKEDKS